MSCIEIDEKAIRETQKILGEREFKRLEKALGLLMGCMNHDATTHKYGVIAGGNKMDTLNDFLKNKLGFEKDIPKDTRGNHLSLPGEVAAAAFHRDIFEEIDELGHPKLQLKKMIVQHASIVLEFLSTIHDEKLRGYWISVLKYPLFSLLSPEGTDCDTIRQNFPELNLSPTQWGKVIHRKINKCSVTYKSEEIIEVTLRDIRKLMMRYYQSQNTRIDTPLAELIAKNASYPPPEDWEDLERMVRAKSFELPMNASDKLIEFHESYRFFTQRFTFAGYGNILFDYEKYLEFKKYGFDVSPWDDKEKWEHAFRKEIERKIEAYEKNGLDIDEAQEISEFFSIIQERYGFGLQERDFPEFIKARICMLTMILHSMKEKGRKGSFVSFLSLRDEFEHLQQLGIIEKELEVLFNTLDITSSVDEGERLPF